MKCTEAALEGDGHLPVLIRQNVFYVMDRSPAQMLGSWIDDLNELEHMLSAEVSPHGIDEAPLLRWFASTKERICLLVYAIHFVMPTHVGREIQIGGFRADFAWVSLDLKCGPTVGMIELENCLEHTLFDKRKRNTPQIGRRFLDGFAQVVDWCAFGQAEASVHAAISEVLGTHDRNAKYDTNYVFSLIVGLRRFAADTLSRKRSHWWEQNIMAGQKTTIMTFDRMCDLGQVRLELLRGVQ